MIPASYKGKAIHTVTFPVRLAVQGWEYKTEERDVRVMVIAEGYAMVRRLGCMPMFVVLRN